MTDKTKEYVVIKWQYTSIIIQRTSSSFSTGWNGLGRQIPILGVNLVHGVKNPSFYIFSR